MGDTRIAHSILIVKPKGRRSFGIPRRRWEGNIRMGIREIGREFVD
jgi:hypothetical protein